MTQPAAPIVEATAADVAAAYDAFAPFYDAFTADYNHDSWMADVEGWARESGLTGNRLSYAGAYAGNLGNTVPLAPGVFLDQVALAVCVDPPPFKIKGQAGVAFGGAKLNAYLQYTDAYQGNPWVIEAGGELYMLDQRIASAMVRYTGNGLLEFDADAAL